MRGISVIIRVRDERASLERCLALLSRQQGVGEVQVIVVDAGSSDGTLEVARAGGARVVPAVEAGAAFSYGGALNLGAGQASHEVLVSLSAHAFARDDRWLARLAEALSASDPRVACACGDVYDPDGARLYAPIAQDAALARRRPEWGYSNAAGAFRAELWRRRPFRADLPGCEDKEWALHWLDEGYTCRVDPALVVDHDHPTIRCARSTPVLAGRPRPTRCSWAVAGRGPRAWAPWPASGGQTPGGMTPRCGLASATDGRPGCWARTTAGEADDSRGPPDFACRFRVVYAVHSRPILGRGSLQLLDGPRRPRASVCSAASDGHGRTGASGIGVGFTVTVHTHGRPYKERS